MFYVRQEAVLENAFSMIHCRILMQNIVLYIKWEAVILMIYTLISKETLKKFREAILH